MFAVYRRRHFSLIQPRTRFSPSSLCVPLLHPTFPSLINSFLACAQVAVLWILDTVDTALCCHILYYYLVTNFLNPAALASPVWSILVCVYACRSCTLTDLMGAGAGARPHYGTRALFGPIFIGVLMNRACTSVQSITDFFVRRYAHSINK